MNILDFKHNRNKSHQVLLMKIMKIVKININIKFIM